MSSTTPWRRHTLGGLSLCLILAGIVIEVYPEAKTDWAFAQGVSTKVGVTLLMCWLAYPQLERLQVWKVTTIVCLGAAFVFRPILIGRLLIFLAPLLFALWMLLLVAPAIRVLVLSTLCDLDA